MNMKKTIAAVAASAVAVSAMATSVSAIDVLEHGTSDLAFQAQTVHYNLVEEKTVIAPTVVLTATFEQVPLAADLNFSIVNYAGVDTTDTAVPKAKALNLIKDVKDIKITGTYVDTTGANVGAVTPIYFSTDEGSEKYNKNLNKTTGAITIDNDSTGIANGTAANARLTVEYTVNLNANFGVYDRTVALAAIDKDTKLYTLSGDGMKAINHVLKINDLGKHATVPTGVEIDLDVADGTTTAAKYDKGESKEYYPFKTGLNDYFNDVTPDVMARLTQLGYVNNMAVINDLIANYDEVTFKFNTAVKAVDDSTKGNSGKYDEDNGNKIYKSFAQHLYNLYGQEYDKNLQNTGYINYDWTGYNLFAGALIINHDMSMSLNDATIFDYGETSLSFNWADLNNGAAYNPVVNYVRSIKLATSREWYWDSLDITGAIVETDQAATNEGTEAEEETIGEDEETEEELGEEEETEEEPAVEEEAAPAENPATGNAPIALAVIPVALAAAAVVAKKRG